MPVAMSVVWATVKDETLGTHERLQLLEDFDHVLGLGIAGIQAEKAKPLSADVKKMLDERAAARKAKDFKKSDELRKKLLEKGIHVEDGPDGQRVR